MRFLLLSMFILLHSLYAIADDQPESYILASGTILKVIESSSALASMLGDFVGTRRVEGSVKKGNQTYVQCHVTLSCADGHYDYMELFRQDKKGLYAIKENAATPMELLILPLPVKIGNTWKDREGKTNTVVGLDSVTIGDKVIENCIHIHSQPRDRTYDSNSWIAPKLGVVGSRTVHKNGLKEGNGVVDIITKQ